MRWKHIMFLGLVVFMLWMLAGFILFMLHTLLRPALTRTLLRNHGCGDSIATFQTKSFDHLLGVPGVPFNLNALFNPPNLPVQNASLFG